MNQLTLNFEPGLPERFRSLREYVAHRAHVVAKPLKAQAADMDMGVSTLSRKLNPADGDTQRFNVDDLESWIQSSGDAAAVIEYLAAKYLDSDDNRKTRMLANAERLMSELSRTLTSLKTSAA